MKKLSSYRKAEEKCKSTWRWLSMIIKFEMDKHRTRRNRKHTFRRQPTHRVAIETKHRNLNFIGGIGYNITKPGEPPQHNSLSLKMLRTPFLRRCGQNGGAVQTALTQQITKTRCNQQDGIRSYPLPLLSKHSQDLWPLPWCLCFRVGDIMFTNGGSYKHRCRCCSGLLEYTLYDANDAYS